MVSGVCGHGGWKPRRRHLSRLPDRSLRSGCQRDLDDQSIAIGAAACLLLSAVLTAAVHGPARRWLLVAVWGQLATYALWMLRHDEFVNVIVEYGSAMLIIGLLYVGLPALSRHRSARWIVAGIVVTIAAAAVQQSGFDLHTYLNHNDLQHLTQMVAVSLLYEGGAELRHAVC